MNLITVIPLTRAKVSETLSYFTASDVPVGAIVTVPLRSKTIHAIVSETRRAEELKMDIRDASYEIRKLGKVKANAFFPVAFIESCETLAEYYATTPGRILDAMIAEAILENVNKIVPPLPIQNTFFSPPSSVDETYAVQGEEEDRVSSWRSLIRQEFARKRSIVIYVPTIEDANRIFSVLEKGIEGYIYILNSSLTKKKILETWARIADTDHSVVVVATASFSLLPRSDIDTVIIERENARGWIATKSPNVDLRHALETISRKRRQTVYLADALLRTETLNRLDEQEISQGSPFKWRSISLAKDSLINMLPSTLPNKTEETTRAFRVLSPELEDLIKTNREDNTHLLIMTVRRGLATATVCNNCETLVTCEHCSAPIVLHGSKETGKNFFMCHKCGSRRNADETCKKCGGWSLTPLGVGLERAEQEILDKFPGIDIFKIDPDTAKADRKTSSVIQKFRAKPGGVLLGTESVLLNISEKIDHAAIVSMDSLFALPDYHMEEKIMYTLIRLRNMTSRSFLVQTRKPEAKVFEYGLKGNLTDFYRYNLDNRKQFNYPPFSVLVKITVEGKKDPIARTMAEIKSLVEPYDIDIFPAFTSTVRNNSIIHGLIKVEPHAWPDKELVTKLRSLPPNVNVKINPESLL